MGRTALFLGRSAAGANSSVLSGIAKGRPRYILEPASCEAASPPAWTAPLSQR